jgi:hypothetical protein
MSAEFAREAFDSAYHASQEVGTPRAPRRIPVGIALERPINARNYPISLRRYGIALADLRREMDPIGLIDRQISSRPTPQAIADEIFETERSELVGSDPEDAFLSMLEERHALREEEHLLNEEMCLHSGSTIEFEDDGEAEDDEYPERGWYAPESQIDCPSTDADADRLYRQFGHRVDEDCWYASRRFATVAVDREERQEARRIHAENNAESRRINEVVNRFSRIVACGDGTFRINGRDGRYRPEMYRSVMTYSGELVFSHRYVQMGPRRRTRHCEHRDSIRFGSWLDHLYLDVDPESIVDVEICEIEARMAEEARETEEAIYRYELDRYTDACEIQAIGYEMELDEAESHADSVAHQNLLSILERCQIEAEASSERELERY